MARKALCFTDADFVQRNSLYFFFFFVCFFSFDEDEKAIHLISSTRNLFYCISVVLFLYSVMFLLSLKLRLSSFSESVNKKRKRKKFEENKKISSFMIYVQGDANFRCVLFKKYVQLYSHIYYRFIFRPHYLRQYFSIYFFIFLLRSLSSPSFYSILSTFSRFWGTKRH